MFLGGNLGHGVHQVDLRSEFERSEDPQSLLVEDAELRVSKRQGRIAQVSSTLCHYDNHNHNHYNNRNDI